MVNQINYYMASKEETLDFVLNQLKGIENITWRKMMGEYIIYYRGTVVGGIYDDRFLLKITKQSKQILPDAPEELPYEGAKPMLSLSDIVYDDHAENKQLLKKLLDCIYNDLGAVKKKNKK